MSLPEFSLQGSLYGIGNLLGDQFPQDDRFRLFAERIHPLLVKARPALEAAYCQDNGRPGIEPVAPKLSENRRQFIQGRGLTG